MYDHSKYSNILVHYSSQATNIDCVLQVAEVGRDAIGLRISPIQFH